MGWGRKKGREREQFAKDSVKAWQTHVVCSLSISTFAVVILLDGAQVLGCFEETFYIKVPLADK